MAAFFHFHEFFNNKVGKTLELDLIGQVSRKGVLNFAGKDFIILTPNGGSQLITPHSAILSAIF